MEVFILSKEQFSELTQRLDNLQLQLDSKLQPSTKPFMDNDDFIAYMGICKRTAQSWRDNGIISFSQIGTKIYYKSTDVDKVLNEHYNKSFKR